MLRFATVLIALLAAALAGWSLLWGAAARKTDAVLDEWIASEAQFGRLWNCPGRRIGGYPLTIEISCTAAQFRGAIGSQDLTGSLQGFRAVATVLNPDRVAVQLETPFTLKTADGAIDLQLGWRALDITIEGRPSTLTRLMIAGDDFAAKGATARFGAFEGQAQSVQASFAPAAAGDSGALDVAIALTGVSVPALANALGLEAPVDAAIGATISGPVLQSAGSLAQRLERWRIEGGLLELKTLQATSGAAKIGASGAIALDDAHRPRGKLDAALEGFNPILRRLGIDPQILAAGALLTGFLRGPKVQGDQPGALRLPLRINEGFVSIGPIRTPFRAPPLY